MDLTTLQPGVTLYSGRLAISPEASVAYRQAVGDDCDIHRAERVVPPLAVVALVMGEAMRAISLPAGAVHTGQEVEFSREVPEGVELECSAVLGQNSVRRGTRFITLDLCARDASGPAVTGRASIVIAEGQEGSAG